MARRACDGAGLLGAFRAAVANLEAHVDEINALNVYPGPGRRHRLEHARDGQGRPRRGRRPSAGQPAERIAAAISFGALMGARGNSGVITSQIFRGHGRGARRQEAVQRPRPRPRPDAGHQDGLRRGRQAGRGHDPHGHPRVGRGRGRGRRAATTTSRRSWPRPSTAPRSRSPGRRACSPILREAGVVDSGGQGLYRLFQGALLASRRPVAGRRAGAGRTRDRRGAKASDARRRTPTRGSATRRCSCCSRRLAARLDVDAIRDHLESIGDSVLVAGDARALKVHVHNERPDLVDRLRAVARVAQPDQRREPRQPGAATSARSRAPAAFTRPADGGDRRDRAPSGDGRRSTPADATTAGRGPSTRLGASSRSSPATASPRSSATSASPHVVQGGQIVQPEHRRAARGDRTARSTPARSSSCPTTRTSSSPPRRSPGLADRPVVVVPTRNAAEGFAALLALDPTSTRPRTPRR